jgi:hypothetical protein
MDRIESKYGVEAHCVVVGDDDNIEIAQEFGLDVVLQNNEHLGRKWNDGHEHAINHGATHIMPVGSDSWVNLDWWLQPGGLVRDDRIIASRNYDIVHRDGTRRVHIWIPIAFGVHFVMPTAMMTGRKSRPCREDLSRGCDTSTLRTIDPGHRNLIFSEAHELESVAFQSRPQITNYNNMRSKFGKAETTEPFSGLAALYGEELADEIEAFYRTERERALEMALASTEEGAVSAQVAKLLYDEMRGLRDDIAQLRREIHG